MRRNYFVCYAGSHLYHLSMTYVANGKSDNGYGKHKKYKVTLTTDFGKVTFQYHDSVRNYENGKLWLDNDDLNNALECFIDDCNAHMNDEYCFGGRMSNREIAMVKRGCKKQYERLMTLVGGSETRRDKFIEAINKVIFDR